MSDTKDVYIRNISGSGLDLATTGFLEKNQITSGTFEEREILRSPEIKKFLGLKFIELVTEEQLEKLNKELNAAKVAPATTEDFLDSVEQPQDVVKAVANVQSALDTLKALLEGKNVKVKRRGRPPKNVPPVEESEASQGESDENENTEDIQMDDIPDQPPAGMEPLNDPVKKMLGRKPYEKPLPNAEVKQFLTDSMDLGMLRELAVFLKPGPLKNLAKRKLREVSAKLGV